MRNANVRRVKVVVGLILGFAIGAICRALDMPAPAPPALAGAALVLSMTLGYLWMDSWAARNASSKNLSAGPDGSVKSDG